MEILRKISHVLITGLLGFVLALGIILTTLSLVLTNRDTVKSWPVDAGIYPKLTEQFLRATDRPPEEGGELNEEEAIQQFFGESPLDRGRLEEAVGSVYTVGYWQEKFETLIDAFYDWLDGTKENLEFHIAFNDRSDELAAAMEEELKEQLGGYPTCPADVNLQEYDPLTASCLPPGVSAEQAASLFSNQIKNEDFLANAALDSDDIEFDEKFVEAAPGAYSTGERLPWIFASTAAILAILAVFSAKSRLHGVRKAGQLLFGIGLVSWLGFFIGNRVGAGFELASNSDNTGEEFFAELGQPLAKVAFDDFTATGLWVALAVVMAGTLMWLGAFTWHKAHHHDEGEANHQAQKPKRDPKLPKPVEPEDKTQSKV